MEAKKTCKIQDNQPLRTDRTGVPLYYIRAIMNNVFISVLLWIRCDRDTRTKVCYPRKKPTRIKPPTDGSLRPRKSSVRLDDCDGEPTLTGLSSGMDPRGDNVLWFTGCTAAAGRSSVFTCWCFSVSQSWLTICGSLTMKHSSHDQDII